MCLSIMNIKFLQHFVLVLLVLLVLLVHQLWCYGARARGAVVRLGARLWCPWCCGGPVRHAGARGAP